MEFGKLILENYCKQYSLVIDENMGLQIAQGLYREVKHKIFEPRKD